MGFSYERELPSPEHLKELLPVSPQLEQIRLDRIDYIKKILSGDYERLLLIIGPCSADNEEAVVDYATRLARLQEKVADKIFI